MHEYNFLQDLLVIFGVGLVAVVAFHRLNLPAVLAFLVTGVFLGPYGFKFVDNVSSIEALAEVGIVLLLFTLGIEFSISHFMRMRRFLLIGGALQVGLTIALTVAIGYLVKVPTSLAFFIGMLLSISSTALVLRVLEGRNELDSAHGRNSLTILIFQDLCIVPMVLITPFLGGKDVQMMELVWIGGKALIFVGCAFTIVRFCLPWILNHVAQTRKREAFVLTSIFLCLGTAWATSHVGLSMALGAFIAGMLLSESKFSHQALGDIVPFRELFNCLVFVSIGMLFDVRTLVQMPVLVGVCLLVVVSTKALIAAGVTRLFRHSVKVSILTGVALCQTSEFSFVLGKVGLASGVIDATTNQLFLSVAILSMMVTPLIFAATPKVIETLERVLPWKPRTGTRPAEPGGSTKLNDHVIIIGFGSKGRKLAEVLERSSIPYVAIDIDPTTVMTESRAGRLIIYGDGANQEVLRFAGVDHARVVAITFADTKTVRRTTDLVDRLNPSVHILARALHASDVQPLIAVGANEVLSEELVTTIEFFVRVLKRYQVKDEKLGEYVNESLSGFDGFIRVLFEAYHRHENLQLVPLGLSVSVYSVEKGSPSEGKSIADSELRKTTGATVAAVRTPKGDVKINPEATEILSSGDLVMVLGRSEQVEAAKPLFKTAAKPAEKA
ncbi:MAG: cation:proton antiporter [Candidatus Obscuribacterales bacterium]